MCLCVWLCVCKNRTGYVVPAPFVIKKSIKPLTSIQPFCFETDARAACTSDDTENTHKYISKVHFPVNRGHVAVKKTNGQKCDG